MVCYAALTLTVTLAICPSASGAVVAQPARRLQTQNARAVCLATDLDGDLRVDTDDLLIALAHFGEAVGATRGDLDGSGGALSASCILSDLLPRVPAMYFEPF